MQKRSNKSYRAAYLHQADARPEVFWIDKSMLIENCFFKRRVKKIVWHSKYDFNRALPQ
jgi:hypothetical protein